MIELTRKNTAELAVTAGDIIRTRELDYFDPKTDQAQAHARAEGIDPSTFVLNIGHGKYTGVPRKYPEDLESRITTVFRRITSNDSQPFIHSVNHRLTVGTTHLSQPPDVAGPGLLIAESGRSCDIRMPLGEILVTHMIPQVNSARDKIPQRSVEPTVLRVGRTILVDGDPDAHDFETAVRDSHRPWEAVLVVGIDSIRPYLNAMEAGVDEFAPKVTGAVSRIEALKQMIDIY